jgi:hypothetical protein
MSVPKILAVHLMCDERTVQVHVIDDVLKSHAFSHCFDGRGRGGSLQKRKLPKRPQQKKVNEEPGDTRNPNRIWCFNGSSFDYLGDRSNEIMTGKNELKVQHRSEIVAIASEGEWAVLADRDSALAIYKGKEHQFSIPIFTSVGRCLAIVRKFQLIVCGTKDHALLFCSLNKGRIVRTVQLGNQSPMLLLVTRAWGFVLTYATAFSEREGVRHLLKLFSVNGEFIREVEIGRRVVAWSTFTCDDGFDYVAMALGDGACHVFEAFWLRIGKSCFRAKSAAIGIAFAKSHNVGILATRDGILSFFPCKLF